MLLPEPRPGLVIGYRHLWHSESVSGQVEGGKARPCVVVLSVRDCSGDKVVTVAPITHSVPADHGVAVEIPLPTKVRLGLDDERARVIVSEVNRFIWPGPDMAPIAGSVPKRVDYGFLPPRLFATVAARLLALASQRKAAVVGRTE
jgi:hypothetical protein